MEKIKTDCERRCAIRDVAPLRRRIESFRFDP